MRARTCAYESAGSSAMEGMVNYLLSDDPWAAAARRDYDFFIVPMANPAGAHNGMTLLTGPRGVHLLLAKPASADSAYEAMMKAGERVRPARFVDVHNWQRKCGDGLLGMEIQRRERFLYYRPGDSQQGKRWHFGDPHVPCASPGSEESLAAYIRREFGARVATLELSWFGRSPDHARRFGGRALWALLMGDAELPD
ncbi:MAG: hypothetical protein HPY83_10865 [Anaerolineae bacterium]|nr:hypothetical protein [Anaerolineae bacterium]